MGRSNNDQNTRQGLSEQSSRALSRLASEGKEIVEIADLTNALETSYDSAKSTASRLGQSGWLTRLQPGTYRIVPFAAGEESTYTAHEFVVASLFAEKLRTIYRRNRGRDYSDPYHIVESEATPPIDVVAPIFEAKRAHPPDSSFHTPPHPHNGLPEKGSATIADDWAVTLPELTATPAGVRGRALLRGCLSVSPRSDPPERSQRS